MFARNKETIEIEEKSQGEENIKKWKISGTSNVITEAIPTSDGEGEPVEIEVEITEGTIELEENMETLEAVTSPEQSVKYIQTTGTSDDSALALLADITSKYRQGERKRQLQEDSANESDAAGKQVEGVEIMEVHLSHVNNLFHCQKCNRSFKLFYHLKEHMKSHSTDNFKCEICNKSYVREIAWKQHLTCYHLEESGACRRPRPGKKIHVCQYCDKQFDHFGHFKEHLRKHTGNVAHMCACTCKPAGGSRIACSSTGCNS